MASKLTSISSSGADFALLPFDLQSAAERNNAHVKINTTVLNA